MSANLRNPKLAVPLALGAVVLFVAAAWMLVVGPQRSKVGSLGSQISSMQQQIDQRRADLATPKADVHVRASDVFRLTRAMPNDTDMAGIIIVLNRLAAGHHLKFNSIQPASPVAQAGFNVQPVTVELQGRFGDVSSYLGALRTLVRVKRHELAATGRLFTVDSVNLALSTDTKAALSSVKATLTVDAFTFAGGVVATPTQPTPSAASGTVAAGAKQ